MISIALLGNFVCVCARVHNIIVAVITNKKSRVHSHSYLTSTFFQKLKKYRRKEMLVLLINLDYLYSFCISAVFEMMSRIIEDNVRKLN